MIAAGPAEPESAVGCKRAPWAEGSVPLRSDGEAAERELRLEIVASRRRRAHRARVAAAVGLTLALTGGLVVIATSLSGGQRSVSGRLAMRDAGEPVSTAAPMRSEIGAAVAVAMPRRKEHGHHQAVPQAPPEQPAASAPVPEAVYVEPQGEAPAEAAPQPEEQVPSPPEGPSEEFGFEH